MTILEIWAMTWIASVREPYHRPSPAYDMAVQKLLRLGLITPEPRWASGYAPTVLGLAYVRDLKAVPVPTEVFK